MIPSLCASLDKMSFACGCNLFGRPNSTVIEMKDWGRCQSKRLEASSYQAVGRKDSDTDQFHTDYTVSRHKCKTNKGKITNLQST